VSESTLTTLGYAIKFSQIGFSQLPITHGKRPAICSWKEYQDRYPTGEELREWHGSGSHGIGLIHGAISGNSEVIDIDDTPSRSIFSAAWAARCRSWTVLRSSELRDRVFRFTTAAITRCRETSCWLSARRLKPQPRSKR
jgi:hypothetical protein